MDKLGKTRFDQLGIAERFRDTKSAEFLFRIKRSDEIPHYEYNGGYRSTLVDRRSVLADLYYLIGDMDKCRDAARTCVDAAVEYFCGAWRDIHPEPYFRTSGTWVDEFRYGAAWAYFLEDEAAARRIAEWVDEDRHNLQESGLQKSEADLYRLIAAHIVFPKRVASLLELLAQRPKKRPRYVAAIVKAIQEGKEREVSEHIDAMLEHFHRTVFNPEDPNCFLDYASSILTALARCRGLQVSVSNQARLHLIES